MMHNVDAINMQCAPWSDTSSEGIWDVKTKEECWEAYQQVNAIISVSHHTTHLML
jgi:hypothetical protein